MSPKFKTMDSSRMSISLNNRARKEANGMTSLRFNREVVLDLNNFSLEQQSLHFVKDKTTIKEFVPVQKLKNRIPKTPFYYLLPLLLLFFF